MADPIALRRRTTSAPNNELGAAVAELRIRSGLSQKELADIAGIRSSSTISRLENGQANRASHDLITKLSAALDEPVELWAAAGVIPATAVGVLASSWRAFHTDQLYERTKPAVRRVHLGSLAQDFLNDAAGALGNGGRVSPGHMAAALKPPRLARIVVGDEPAVRFDETAIVVTRRKAPSLAGGDYMLGERDDVVTRFLQTHAVAHILLNRQECGWPVNTVDEADVDDLATQLLLPPLVLRNVFNAAVRDATPEAQLDGWSPGTTHIIEDMARRAGAPAWVAVRRLAEEDLLQLESQGAAL